MPRSVDERELAHRHIREIITATSMRGITYPGHVHLLIIHAQTARAEEMVKNTFAHRKMVNNTFARSAFS